MDKYFKLAIDNVYRYGDTDIFPFPIENVIFYDNKKDVVQLLQKIHKDFHTYFANDTPQNLMGLSPAGYTGFRWANQIDSIWNIYFLSLVLSLGDEIEKTRIPKNKGNVFSYRFKVNNKTSSFFDTNIGWKEFQEKSLEFAKDYDFILLCDISDFYSRIYHHRLENSLDKLVDNNDATKRIMKMLQYFSNNNSYGLPIGGPAARILAELLLNRTDRLFKSSGIKFCRFVDDYHIFTNSKEEAYQNLVSISEKLLSNEGLSLQKAKTRIMTCKEFVDSTEFFIEYDDSSRKKDFLRLTLKYDPYSLTADQDYKELKDQINKFDISSMLVNELSKSRVHSSLTKKLIKAIKYIGERERETAILSLLDNIDILAPLFSIVSIAIKELFLDISQKNQEKVLKVIRELISSNSHIIQVEINLCYAIRLLGLKYSDENESLLVQIYNRSVSDLVKRDIILIMAKWNVNYWISDRKNYFSNMKGWERRAFIISSFVLGDEGKHWYTHAKKEFNEVENICASWAKVRFKKQGFTNLPL